MTLVTTVMTNNWVALAADRRLTWTNRLGDVVRQEDADTKLAVIEGEMLIGYAGATPISDLGGGFGMWLVEVLADLTSGPVIPFLQMHLSNRWATTPALHDQGFVVVLAGYSSNAFGRPMAPEITLISNAFDVHGDFSPWIRPSRDFRTRVVTAVEDQYCIITQGYPVDLEDLRDVRLGPDARTLTAASAATIRKALMQLHSSVADQASGPVGTATMVAFLTRGAFGSATLVTRMSDGRMLATGPVLDPAVSDRLVLNYDTQIVAHFADSGGGGGSEFTPATVATGRPSGRRFISSSGVEIGHQLSALIPLTAEDEVPWFRLGHLSVEDSHARRLSYYNTNMNRRMKGSDVPEEQVDAWVAEAEAGYDVEDLKKKVIGRPGRATEPSQVIPVRLTPDELSAVMARAEREHLNRSEAIRAALAAWSHAA